MELLASHGEILKVPSVMKPVLAQPSVFSGEWPRNRSVEHWHDRIIWNLAANPGAEI